MIIDQAEQVSVLTLRALVYVVYVTAPDFWKLPRHALVFVLQLPLNPGEGFAGGSRGGCKPGSLVRWLYYTL